VAELLVPFVGNGGEWKTRLRAIMEWGNLEKGRRFFDLFLRLLDDGTLDEARDRFASNGTFWSMLHGLAEQRPTWCAELAAHWLDRRRIVAKAAPEESERPWSLLNDGFGGEELLTSARGNPMAFLECVLPAVLRMAAAFTYGEDEEEFSRDQVWPSRYRGEGIEQSEAYLSACETAFEIIGRESPGSLRPFVAQLSAHRLYTANHLLMSACLCAPEVFTEDALQLLADEPKRLSCGYSDSAFWVARQVIEKCSAFCSDETFRRLEEVLLSFMSPYERTKEGRRARGHAAFNLASSLASERRSRNTNVRIAEWIEKFKTPDGPPRGIHCYSVESPIKKESALHMTDEQWLRTIARYDSDREMYDYERPERGGAGPLAGMMQGFVKEQPERFARLALRFPDNAEPSYFMNVLYGLREAAIPGDMKLAVARRIFGRTDSACLCAVLDLLGTITDTELSNDAVQFIRRIAEEHSDPQAELWEAKRPDYGGDILTHGLNTVRGHAAGAMRALIHTDARYLTLFTPTIEKLVADPSLAVRACLASTLAVAAMHDTPQALQWMRRLLDADDRLLVTAYVGDFIRRGLRGHFDTFAPIIERMLRSEHEKVRQEGGLLACLARLYHERADPLSESALRGDAHCRLGACGVAGSNLLYPECRAWCETTLCRFFADENEGVRKKAAGCFRQLWKSPDTPLTDFDPLIRAFLESPAFADEPAVLLRALENTNCRVPDTSLDVCEVFVTRCAERARDSRGSFASGEHTVVKLVFTAYAQLQANELQARALHLIDRMCLEGLHSAGKHLSDFER
jgi:hypothetical protein